MSRIGHTICLAFAAAMFVNLPGCGEQTEGFVYVDNGGSEPIVVEVNGEKLATVLPRKFEKIRLDLGQHHFRISSGGSVIYDAMHTLDYGDRPFKRPTFILNPDNLHRYCEVAVVYGDDHHSRRSVDEMVNLVSLAASKKAAGRDDDAKRLEWEANKRIRSQFRELKYDLEAFGDGPFFRFETPHNILKPLPTSVRGSNYSDSTERSTLIRVPVEVHRVVEQSLDVDEPTQEDLEQLTLAQELVLTCVPFRE